MKYNGDKQGLDKKIEDVENKIPYVSKLVTNTAFHAKIEEVENKMPPNGHNTSNRHRVNVDITSMC